MGYKGVWRGGDGVYTGRGTKHFKPHNKGKRTKRQPASTVQAHAVTDQPDKAHITEPINTETVHAVPVVAETKGDPYLPATTSVDPLPVSVTVAEDTAIAVVEDDLPLAIRDPLLDDDGIEEKRPQGKQTLTNTEIAWMLQLRRVSRLTQEQIGKRLGCSQRTVSKYLRLYDDCSKELVKAKADTDALVNYERARQLAMDNGNPDTYMDLLDRSGALTKPTKDSGGGVTINIGDADKVGVQINNSRWE